MPDREEVDAMHVTQMLHDAIVRRRGLAKQVAKALNKPYSTLLRELNPWDRGAKIGVDDLSLILKSSGDVSALKAIAEDLGYKLTPIKEKRA